MSLLRASGEPASTERETEPRGDVARLAAKVQRASTETALGAALMDACPVSAAGLGMYLFATPEAASEVHVRGVSDRFIDDCERFGRTADVLMPVVARTHAPVHDALLGSWEWWTSTPHHRQLGAPHALGHYLLAPVVAGGRLVGSVHMVRRLGEGAFGSEDLALASAVSLHVSNRLQSLRFARSAVATWATQLTARQVDTAELILKGLSNRQIASVLGLSIDGVKKHVRNLFRKLDVDSRAELASALHAPPPAPSRSCAARTARGLPNDDDAVVHYWPSAPREP